MSSNRAFFKNFTTSTYDTSKNSEIVFLSINQTGTRLINTRTDRTIRIWKCHPDKLADPVVIENPHLRSVDRVSWNPRTEHSFASVGRDNLVKIWKANGLLEKKIEVTKNDGSAAVCHIVEYSADGEVLAVVDRDSTVTLFSQSSNYTQIGLFKASEHVYDMAWFNSGHSYFLLALHDGRVLYYRQNDTGAFEPTHTLTGHRSSAMCVSIDPRGRFFAVGSNDGVVSIWNTASLFNTKVLTAVDEGISCIDISRDGTYLAVSYDSGSNSRIFDYESSEEAHEIPNSVSGSLAFSQCRWFPSKTAFVYTSDGCRSMSLARRSNDRTTDRTK